MKNTIILLLAGLAMVLSFSGCYVYTTDPLPAPVIIVPPQGATVPPQQQAPASNVPKAPSGPPAGEVGPPKS